MLSPADMDRIMIIITTACIHGCSNCVRSSGHYKSSKPMDFETFKKAVDSMDGYKGKIGVAGGEPTIHPEFSKFVKYFGERVKDDAPSLFYKQPRCNVADGIRSSNLSRKQLYTSFGEKYRENFELIQDVFGFQNLNDHSTPGLHQALFITRKELGVPDEKWFALRDKCWIQNLWSASVTPKGAFFCERAAVLDELFNGPGGWPIEPGWWKRKPCDFGEQLKWCELCCAPLAVPRNPANEEIDLVSPVMLEMLKNSGSPRILQGKYRLFDPKGYKEADYLLNQDCVDWYRYDEDETISRGTNKTLFPHDVRCLALGGAQIPQGARAKSIDGDISPADFESLAFKDWALVANASIAESESFLSNLKSLVFNPGCIYYRLPGSCDPKDIFKNSPLLLFNRNASALANVQKLPLDASLLELWPEEKRVSLDNTAYLGHSTLKEKISWRLEKLFKNPAWLLKHDLKRARMKLRSLLVKRPASR